MTGRSSEPSITAAVLSYDGRHLLEGLLPTLAAQTVAGLRIVVVDNGSSDGTADWLRSEWPDVAVVALPQNVGVTAALNHCVRAASDSELIALLNNDTELEPDCLAQLAAALEAHPGAGSAAPKLLDFHDRSVLDGAGDAFVWRGSATRRGHGERDSGQYDHPEEVFGACGGAALYRRSAFDRVGLFDESYFAFYEDVDWNLRAQLAGLGCRYVPAAVVYHMGSATIGAGLTRLHAVPPLAQRAVAGAEGLSAALAAPARPRPARRTTARSGRRAAHAPARRVAARDARWTARRGRRAARQAARSARGACSRRRT